MVKNSGDIALQVTNIQQAVAFFRDILGKEVVQLNKDFFKVYTNDCTLYLVEGEEFNVIFEFLTDNVSDYKEKSLKNGCEILKWDGNDHWVKHESGFAFHIGKTNSLWIEEYIKNTKDEISKYENR